MENGPEISYQTPCWLRVTHNVPSEGQDMWHNPIVGDKWALQQYLMTYAFYTVSCQRVFLNFNLIKQYGKMCNGKTGFLFYFNLHMLSVLGDLRSFGIRSIIPCIATSKLMPVPCTEQDASFGLIPSLYGPCDTIFTCKLGLLSNFRSNPKSFSFTREWDKHRGTGA